MSDPIQRDPELTDVLRAAFRGWAKDFHTAIPGKIVSYDASKGQVDVQPLVQQRRKQKNGTTLAKDYPIVRSAQVLFPRCAGGYITFPLAVGDCGLIIFSERDLDKWVKQPTGSTIDPGEGNTHTLMGGVFYPGLYSEASPVSPTPSTSDIEIVPGSGKVNVGGASLTDADLVAIGELVDARLASVRGAYNSHKHLDPVSGSTGVPDTLIDVLASVKATKTRAK